MYLVNKFFALFLSFVLTLFVVIFYSNVALATYDANKLDQQVNAAIQKIKSNNQAQARAEFERLKKYIFSLKNDGHGGKYVHLLGLKMAFSNIDANKVKKTDCPGLKSQLELDFA
ncbi:MAG: hypothetical protein KDD50_01765, partial [Bdellovibrionales bacterium]|nr:hypothetical protein [Bdellovibrionales bacterium]